MDHCQRIRRIDGQVYFQSNQLKFNFSQHVRQFLMTLNLMIFSTGAVVRAESVRLHNMGEGAAARKV